MNSTKKPCEICHEKFPRNSLYPLPLVRKCILELANESNPKLNENGYLCFTDLRTLGLNHLEKMLKQERGALSELEKEVVENLQKQEFLAENVNEEFEERMTIGEKLSDHIAAFGGSWKFIILFLMILVVWMGFNSYLYLTMPFDPYPYILLNLLLSSLAAFQAPIIMMSQNRQASKDRLSQENAYQINLKSELQIRHLNSRLELYMKHSWEKLYEIERNQEEMLQELESSLKKL